MKVIEVSSLKKPDGMVNLALNINELAQPIHDARQAEPLQKRPVVASAQLQVLDVCEWHAAVATPRAQVYVPKAQIEVCEYERVDAASIGPF